MDITSLKHVTQMRYMWTSYIVMLQQSALKKTLNFYFFFLWKYTHPFWIFFSVMRTQQYNIMLLLMFRVKYDASCSLSLSPDYNIIIFSVSLCIYVCVLVLYLHISPGMINDAHDNVIRMIFFNEPKIEYYNNIIAARWYLYVQGIIERCMGNKALLI